jgi:hypothetical protein
MLADVGVQGGSPAAALDDIECAPLGQRVARERTGMARRVLPERRIGLFGQACERHVGAEKLGDRVMGRDDVVAAVHSWGRRVARGMPW